MFRRGRIVRQALDDQGVTDPAERERLTAMLQLDEDGEPGSSADLRELLDALKTDLPEAINLYFDVIAERRDVGREELWVMAERLARHDHRRDELHRLVDARPQFFSDDVTDLLGVVQASIVLLLTNRRAVEGDAREHLPTVDVLLDRFESPEVLGYLERVL